jgi:hypothetical protein
MDRARGPLTILRSSVPETGNPSAESVGGGAGGGGGGALAASWDWCAGQCSDAAAAGPSTHRRPGRRP